MKTPRQGSGLLPGVTRAVIVELAGELGLEVGESRIQPEEVGAADGAFITMSSHGLVEVNALDGQPVSRSKLTRSIYAAYCKAVLHETS